MENKPKLLFTERSLHLILEAFGKSINEDGFIIDSTTKELIETPDGDTIKHTEFGGMKKGSEIFIKEDLHSIINLTEGKY